MNQETVPSISPNHQKNFMHRKIMSNGAASLSLFVVWIVWVSMISVTVPSGCRFNNQFVCDVVTPISAIVLMFGTPVYGFFLALRGYRRLAEKDLKWVVFLGMLIHGAIVTLAVVLGLMAVIEGLT